MRDSREETLANSADLHWAHWASDIQAGPGGGSGALKPVGSSGIQLDPVTMQEPLRLDKCAHLGWGGF